MRYRKQIEFFRIKLRLIGFYCIAHVYMNIIIIFYSVSILSTLAVSINSPFKFLEPMFLIKNEVPLL